MPGRLPTLTAVLLAACTGGRGGVNPSTAPDPPWASRFNNCTQLWAAGWTEGVSRYGGTYFTHWNQAERKTYARNQHLKNNPVQTVTAFPGAPVEVVGRQRESSGSVCERR